MEISDSGYGIINGKYILLHANTQHHGGKYTACIFKYIDWDGIVSEKYSIITVLYIIKKKKKKKVLQEYYY